MIALLETLQDKSDNRQVKCVRHYDMRYNYFPPHVRARAFFRTISPDEINERANKFIF